MPAVLGLSASAGEYSTNGTSWAQHPSTGSYGTIIPTHPFAINNNNWGAWELAGRYSVTELNDRLDTYLAIL
jgi:phosphate-selective porin OprO/OprP